MTTRSRTRWARATALVALIGGLLAVAATPAAGAPAPIRFLSVSAENLKPGDTVRIRFRVTNTGKAAETAIVVVGGGLTCNTGCRAEPNLGPGESRDLDAKLTAPKVNPGETSGLNISVAVRLGGQNSFDHRTVYVSGTGASPPGAGEPAAGVDRVIGRVRDTAGKAIGGAAVTVGDSAGHEYTATSDRSGRFAIRSSAANPIAKGTITVIAVMDGYRTAGTTVKGRAGGTATVRLTLAAAKAAPTTAPPSAAAPLVAADETPEASTAAAAPPSAETLSDDGGSLLPYTLLGGLLVAAGLGALALMAARRRRDAAPAVADAPTALLHTTLPRHPRV
ncbi:carboxypeptidase-like regulatory domain-containing protein [Actinoplanes sp. NPDC051861]|uniref:carboxypeptidase-like regulatory domain-containing protein n=1 Tax=Actinoplanes sp. NPDC051861 TaxID=3155170 RepID=UPI003449FFC7